MSIKTARPRTLRTSLLLLLLLTYAAYIAFLAAPPITNGLKNGLEWLQYGIGAGIALLFLSVGTLVLLYARDRMVARVLFPLCVCMMITFTLLSVSQNALLASVSTASSSLAIFLFSTLLLLFPRNYLALRERASGRVLRAPFLLRSYTALLGCWALGIVIISAVYWQAATLPVWGEFLLDGFSVVGLSGCLATIIVSWYFRRQVTLRERQQRRIFVGGSLVAIAPLLFLTLLPSWLNLPAGFIVNGQLSALSVGVLPVALGYAILRYQILALDRHVRRVVGWIVGSIAVALLGYLAIVTNSLFLGNQATAPVILVAVGLAIYAWYISQALSERLFFPEAAYYHHMLAHSAHLAQQDLDLHQAALALEQEAMDAFETPSACVFLLYEEPDRGLRCFRLPPSAGGQDGSLLPLALRLLGDLGDRSKAQAAFPGAAIDYDAPAIALLAQAPRPLYLRELLRALGGDGHQGRPGFARYLDRFEFESGEPSPLLVPIRTQGQLIGILALAERGGQGYAGPEFDAIDLLLERFAHVLETARLYEQATRQQARVNAELAAAFERQKELDRLKDQFMMTASHELRTPLTAVQGYLELLQMYYLKLSVEQIGDLLSKAQLGCDEVVLLVNNIMDASQVQGSVQELVLTTVPLLESVGHVLEILEAMTRLDQREMRVDIAGDLLILADDLRLRQVLLNLLTNALKYTPAASPLFIEGQRREHTVEVRLRDFGPGIPAEKQALLFERFERLDRDINSPVRGAGLGLYICKQLVEAMGGRIWVESSGVIGEGSVFAFALQLDARGEQGVPGATGSPGGTRLEKE